MELTMPYVYCPELYPTPAPCARIEPLPSGGRGILVHAPSARRLPNRPAAGQEHIPAADPAREANAASLDTPA
jgi:hypothetical protein